MNGVILVYKEKGFTSHDVVAKLRGILKMKKIGHTGTLDPDAEGVLPVCLGNATKLCDFLTEKTKIYEAELVLGKQTDTQDLSGQVIHKYDGEFTLSEEEIRRVVEGFVGAYDQIPPMYSAVKVNGKKLYELARQGIEIERKARRVTIYDIEIQNIELPVVKIRVTCSKGTYIRTLCNDIGEQLHVYGCMGALLRTGSGQFLLKDCKKLGEIEQAKENGTVEQFIIPTEDVLAYPKLYVKPEFEKILMNGNPLVFSMIKNQEEIDHNVSNSFNVYGTNGFVGVYQKKEGEQILKVSKMFLS